MAEIAPRPRVLHPIAEPEDVGEARRAARALATAEGASEAEVGRVELAATELGTNTLLHARRTGYLLVQALPPHAGRGVELLAVDRGPGIADVDRALAGRSVEETEAALAAARAAVLAGAAVERRGLGCGLASVRRLATEFDLHTRRESGTVVLARFRFQAAPPGAAGVASWFRCAGVSLPMVPETDNGDQWAFVDRGSRCAVLLVDGLGHGTEAARAAQAAVAALRRREYGDREADVGAFFHEAHGALRATRGAAATFCRISSDDDQIAFAGVGNVEGRVYAGGRAAALVPRNGTLGMDVQPPKVVVSRLPWPPGATLVLASDGVRGAIELDARGGLGRHDPAVIAATLHRDLTRGRDDATVVVVRDTRAGGGAALEAEP